MKAILLIALVVASCTFAGCDKKKQTKPKPKPPVTSPPAKT